MKYDRDVQITPENIITYYKSQGIIIKGLNERELRNKSKSVKIKIDVFKEGDLLAPEIKMETLINRYHEFVFDYKEVWNIDISMLDIEMQCHLIQTYRNENEQQNQIGKYTGIYFNGIFIEDINKVIIFVTEKK